VSLAILVGGTALLGLYPFFMVNAETLWLDKVWIGNFGDKGRSPFVSVVPHNFVLDPRGQFQVLVTVEFMDTLPDDQAANKRYDEEHWVYGRIT
jgi:hypothetical protein